MFAKAGTQWYKSFFRWFLHFLLVVGRNTLTKWELMGVFTIVCIDPALIRSDNTVRNGISTIGLLTFSCQSKGLLKHSAVQHCSLSFSLPFFCFSSSINSLFLLLFPLCHSRFLYLSVSVFLFLLIPSDSPHSSFVKEKRGHEYHTQTLSHPLHSAVTAARFFPSQVNHCTLFELVFSFSFHYKSNSSVFWVYVMSFYLLRVVSQDVMAACKCLC